MGRLIFCSKGSCLSPPTHAAFDLQYLRVLFVNISEPAHLVHLSRAEENISGRKGETGSLVSAHA